LDATRQRVNDEIPPKTSSKVEPTRYPKSGGVVDDELKKERKNIETRRKQYQTRSKIFVTLTQRSPTTQKTINQTCLSNKRHERTTASTLPQRLNQQQQQQQQQNAIDQSCLRRWCRGVWRTALRQLLIRRLR
jgi:hypothetical protein